MNKKKLSNAWKQFLMVVCLIGIFLNFLLFTVHLQRGDWFGCCLAAACIGVFWIGIPVKVKEEK